MAREVVETCDVCSRVVSDVLRDDDETSLRNSGYGYIQAKRIEWRFGPFPRRLWHREDLGFEIVCDPCLDTVRELSLISGREQDDPGPKEES